MSAVEQMEWVNDIIGEWEFVDLFARYTEIVGLKIVGIEKIDYDDEAILINFDDGSRLKISDEGQSCCENRYLTCDDDLTGHEGARLLYIGPGIGPMPEDSEEEDSLNHNIHDVMFVKVQTTKGSFTLCTHNEHNGYYGGFQLEVRRER
jgi:hypothetical protein